MAAPLKWFYPRRLLAGAITAAITVPIVTTLYEWHESMPFVRLKPKTKEQREMTSLYKEEPWPYPEDQEAVFKYIENRKLATTSKSARTPTFKAKEQAASEALWKKLQQDIAEELVARGEYNSLQEALNAESPKTNK